MQGEKIKNVLWEYAWVILIISIVLLVIIFPKPEKTKEFHYSMNNTNCYDFKEVASREIENIIEIRCFNIVDENGIFSINATVFVENG